MLSSRWFLFSLLPLFFTLNSEANQQLIPRYSECNEKLGNFTGGSVYKTNLDTVLGNIYTDKKIDYGFYNFTYGEDPDQVNAIGLCRGDTTPEECRDCLKTCTALLTDRCSTQKEAIGYYDLCTLRYSNASIFGVNEPETSKVYNIQEKTVVDKAFNETVSGLLQELKSAAAKGDSRHKFAEKSAQVIDESSGSNSNETIYGLVQCTPDLTEQNCTDCLDSAYGQISIWCREMKGCLFLGPSCSVRYDITPFFKSIVNTHSPAPQPSEAITPVVPPKPPKGTSRKLKTAIAIVVAVVVAGILVVGICIYFERRKPRLEYTADFEDKYKNEDEFEAEAEAGNDLKVGDLLQFDFETIRLATNNFSDENMIGQGGFGAVYKGTLSDGQDIAIKRLANNSKQGETEFKNEVLLTGKLQHRNLVKLLGFCLQKRERLLIYEFVSNKSLDYIIFDPIKRANLNWEIRHKIIRDIARGLLYLHEDSRLQIVHRDLKTSNILLDDELNPKIADFGIAKLFDAKQTHGMTSNVIGTYGYMAPEYVMFGEFSVKSDVFSFGVLVLEIISGQKACCVLHGQSQEDLLSFAWRNWREGTITNIIDPSLSNGSQNEIMRCIHIGLLCVQENLVERPTMATVALMLSSYSISLSVPLEPAAFVLGRTRSLPVRNMQFEGESRNHASITDPYPR